jgi:predicted DNA binding CopG/RHH family protein
MNHMMTVKKSKMKSITIHGIDEPLAKLIKSKAKQKGLSINQTIKNILESSLGVKPKDYLDNISRFEEFCVI